MSANGDRLCLSNGRGYLGVFDLHTLKQISQFSFASAISGDLFSADGNRLFVLTSDQTGYVLDVSSSSPNSYPMQ
jgi:hypothetical protein